MINLNDLIEKAKGEGYTEANAEAKVSQDIILTLISGSGLERNITVKGGVVMRSISKNARRATQDIDLDFIRYSLEDDSIHRFISKLDSVGMFSVKIVGQIEELKQQDYHGKRVFVEISDDSGRTLTSKIDFGVHKNLSIQQEEYCFDVGMDEGGVSLLINSKEQMLAEKLRSLLKLGQFSTRYKDIFDMYYLLESADKNKLSDCFEYYIYSDPKMKENNISDVVKRVESIFKSRMYIKQLQTSKNNWLDKDTSAVLAEITETLRNISEK